ncbi:MAG: hypothetical protein ACOX9C_03645 [Kiritimatiellia bacterium]|jgi:uncharacterized coiled-coil protein SlyX
MAEKKTESSGERWFWRKASGKASEPVDLKAIRAKVATGDVTAQTQVSRDGSTWSLAMAQPELGFDCIVLEIGEHLNVLGPFARDYVDRADVMSDIPRDGILFIRSGTIGEALPALAVGTTGAALVERVVEAEKAYRESDKARRAAEAALAAKDLEFDAERQKLKGELSGMKAAELKLKAEIDSLRGEIENKTGAERARHDLEARLVDSEALVAAAKTSAQQAEKKAKTSAALVDDLKNKAADLEAAMAESKKRVESQETRINDLTQRLSEANDRIDTREARCLDLEGRLSEAQETLAAAEKAHAAAETRSGEQEQKLAKASKALAASRDATNWFRSRLADLISEVDEKFNSNDDPAADNDSDASSDGAAPVYVDAEFVEEDSPPNRSVKLRPAKAEGRAASENMVKLSAIENQLKREISTLSASTPAASGGREGIMGVFKRRR